MGCCAARPAPPSPPRPSISLMKAPPSPVRDLAPLQKCINVFHAVIDKIGITELIHLIKEQIELKESQQQNTPDKVSKSVPVIQEIPKELEMWPSITKSGSQLLEILNEHMERYPDNRDFNGTKVSREMLQQVPESYWVVGLLSMIAYLLSEIEQISENRTECLQLLGDMTELARRLEILQNTTTKGEEQYTNAIQLIVQGSIICASQLGSKKIFSFIKLSVDSTVLSSIRKKVNELYPDLVVTTAQKTMELPIGKPAYRHKAVGIEQSVNEVLDSLKQTTMLPLAVVIHGVGGIGKTTLADAVVAQMDLSHYNYTRVDIYKEPQKNGFKSIQQQILKDCFPTYNGGKLIKLRDCAEGRSLLMNAFQCKTNKPVFLFIDNALWSLDLMEIFPEDLGGLPQGSKILVTARYLAATDMFQTPTLQRESYPLRPLPRDPALDILLEGCKDRNIINSNALNTMLSICKGIPLVLKIVGSQLLKQGYKEDKCARLFDTLRKGGPIEDDDLTQRLVGFVYGELEGYTQDAFLDICSFFNNWKRPHVESIVGEVEVRSLLEAALITTTAMHSEPNLDEEKLVVHDTILAIGRSMAESSRILDIESLSEAADEEKLYRIKGIWLVEDESEYVLDEMHLNALSKSLRVLALGDTIGFSGICQMKFEELRFLRLAGDISHLPVQLEELGKLRLVNLTNCVDANFKRDVRRKISPRVICIDREDTE